MVRVGKSTIKDDVGRSAIAILPSGNANDPVIPVQNEVFLASRDAAGLALNRHGRPLWVDSVMPL
jgi:hypothetical protein